MHIDHSHSSDSHRSMLYNPHSHSGNFMVRDSNECLIHNSILSINTSSHRSGNKNNSININSNSYSSNNSNIKLNQLLKKTMAIDINETYLWVDE